MTAPAAADMLRDPAARGSGAGGATAASRRGSGARRAAASGPSR